MKSDNETKTKSKVKTKKTIAVPFSIKWPKKGESIKPTLQTTNVLISGILITCIALSFVSGLIDLVFFSGLSKSWYTIATLKVAAGIVFSIMSLGFTSAKFWCAMQIGAINELQTRLKNDNYKWYKNLNKLKWKWHAAHKFLIGVSLITSISLSVVSIGDAIRKNQNVIKRANEDIVKITKYYNTTDTSDEVQFKALVQGTSASSTAGTKAAEAAAKIWPIIEEYRAEMAEFPVARDSKDPIEWNGKEIIPDDYWTERNAKVQKDVNVYRNLSLYQIRNIKSEAQLATTIKEEIEKSVANNSLDELTELADKTKNKAVQEIKNLEGRYIWPDGTTVVFDENNISGAINTLSDVKAAYENDTGDVGESAKMFMLIGPQLENANKTKAASVEEAFDQDISVSSFGTTEIMMMLLIMIFGIVQEFLIALFTPKSTIDRKMLSRFDAYFGADFNIDMFLLKVYKDYLKKGIISQKDFEIKARKCVELMEDTVDDVIARYSKKNKNQKALTEAEQARLEDLKKYYEIQLENEREFTKYIQGRDSAKNIDEVTKAETPKIDLEKEEPSEPVVEATQEEVKSEPEDMPIRETKPSKILRETNSPRLQRMYGDVVESQAIPATIETPVVEMKPVVDEQPVENTEANINMEKLQKLNEALNSFESDLEDK